MSNYSKYGCYTLFYFRTRKWWYIDFDIYSTMYDLIKCNCSAGDFVVVDWVRKKIVKCQNVNKDTFNAIKIELESLDLKWG